MWGDSAATREAATRLSARVTVGAGGAAVRMDHELKVRRAVHAMQCKPIP